MLQAGFLHSRHSCYLEALLCPKYIVQRPCIVIPILLSSNSFQQTSVAVNALEQCVWHHFGITLWTFLHRQQLWSVRQNWGRLHADDSQIADALQTGSTLQYVLYQKYESGQVAQLTAQARPPGKPSYLASPQ